MKNCLLLCLCWLVFDAEAGCSSDTRGKVEYPSSTITLQKKNLEEFYYYRADHYAIVVEPEMLARRLEERIRHGASLRAERLLKDIRSGRPSGHYKDLFALVLEDDSYLMDTEYLLADILESGDATVIDVWSSPGEQKRFVPTAVLTRIKDGGYRAREFCTPNGDLLLRVRDAVE